MTMTGFLWKQGGVGREFLRGQLPPAPVPQGRRVRGHPDDPAKAPGVRPAGGHSRGHQQQPSRGHLGRDRLREDDSGLLTPALALALFWLRSVRMVSMDDSKMIAGFSAGRTGLYEGEKRSERVGGGGRERERGEQVAREIATYGPDLFGVLFFCVESSGHGNY